MTITSWNPDVVVKKATAEMALRMDRAVIFLRDEVKKSINRGNPTGLDPSLPGEPPKKVTSRLFQSIAKAVIITPYEVIGVYGTNVEYALRLELGFVGQDALNRIVNQAPRPYIRPALQNNRARVAGFFK